MKITRESFPAAIKAIKRHNGWKTADMAKSLGINHRTLERWEQGGIPSGIPETVNMFLENKKLFTPKT